MSGALKRIGLGALGIVLVVGSVAVAVYMASESRLNTRQPVATAAVDVPTDIAAIQHGQHLVGAVALCARCHGANLGGRVLRDDRSGRVVAPNLTRGGVAGTSTVQDLVRAIRNGVDPTGRPLWSMPSDDYNRLTDTDVGTIVAYLQSLPPVTTSLPPREMRPFGRLALVTGGWQLLAAADIDTSLPRLPAPEPGVTAGYGGYLATIAGCTRCHGGGLSETSMGLRGWSEADFVRAMRTGRTPDNGLLDPSMPWRYYAQMSDLELRAIWQFIGAAPPTAARPIP